jgi:Protein of unknown function (DUF3137)
VFSDFESYYQQEILPELLKIEQERIKRKTKVVVAIVVSAFIGVVFALIARNAAGLFAGAVSFIFYAIFYRDKGDLHAQYKNQIIRRAVTKYFPDIQYELGKGFPEGEFDKLGLFNQSPDRYNCEDLFFGQIDKTIYSFSEVHAEYKTTRIDSRGRTRTEWHDIFKGIIYTADFNKYFHNTVVVRRDAWKLFSSNNRIQMEDPRFESRFDVFSADDHETRYILSPALMERIMEVDDRFGGILLSFRESKVILTVPMPENKFDMSIWNSVLRPNVLLFELQLIASMRSIIDTLELNTRIWTKP